MVESIGDSKQGEDKEWLPLESDPQLFSDYAEAIGFPTTMFKFHDVFGVDKEMWTVYIPQPVIAAILCYEIKPQHRELLDQQEQTMTEEQKGYKKPFFIKQLIKNACGTMGLLHALSNVQEQCGGYREDSFMKKLTTEYKDGSSKGTPEERAQLLNEDKQLEEVHQVFSAQGQSGMDTQT